MSISKSPSTLFVLFSWILISCATQGRLIAKSGKFSSPALGLLSKASASSEITCTVVGFSESAFLNISQKFSAAIRGDSPRRDVVEAIGEGTENRDFFIFDVSKVQQQFESTLFVAKIQRLLDHSLQHCRPIRLFIFFQDNPAFFATSIYRSIELMVRLANLEYNGENNSLLIDVVYRDISQIDNALDVIANEFMVQDRAVAKLLQEKVLSKTSATFETNPSKISSKSEYAETFENFEILLSSFQRLVDEEFMRIIRNVLEATDANVFVENVKTALLSVNQYHYLQNSHLIDEVVLVSNVKLMADRVRFVLSKSLLMLSREIVRVVHRGGVRNFRLHLRKLSPKANVPWLIQKEIESRLTKQLKLLSDINQGKFQRVFYSSITHFHIRLTSHSESFIFFGRSAIFKWRPLCIIWF